MKIIMIAGLKRSGKDYIANLIKTELESQGNKVTIASFATPLKQIIANTLEISLEDLETYKNGEDNYQCQTIDITTDKRLHSISVRKILQNFGTEAMKPIFGKNVWGNLMADKINNSKSTDYFIIPDYRFDPEFEYLSQQGHNINTLLVIGPTTNIKDNHSSESLPTKPFDYVINNKAQDSSVNEIIKTYCTKGNL